MENEPNLKNYKNDISDYQAGNYNRWISKCPKKNEPKRTQFAWRPVKLGNLAGLPLPALFCKFYRGELMRKKRY